MNPVLIVHGGAWEIPDGAVDDHLNGLKQALIRGWDVLKQGGSALDCVEETVVVLEDDPTFDAGRGSILNTDGSVEMDASIMDGKGFDAGAVAALRNFANPIRIARKVLDETEHMLLAGQGCEAFALNQGFHQVPIEELLTPRELKRLERLMSDSDFETPHAFGKKKGTVGAVALDAHGDIAAATSTGGTPKKLPGRVGDTPLIGCGTYAENGVGGVSCTGWGESIMKVMLARETAEALRTGHSSRQSAERALNVLKERAGGLGGIICLDREGEPGAVYNTPRMAWGYMRPDLNSPFTSVD